MNKPLAEWTLGEIQAECEEHEQNCESCPFYSVSHNFNSSSNCKITRRVTNRVPEDWDLSEPPRWTDDEIEFAKMFKAACKNKIFFERLSGSQILLWGEEGIDPTANAVLPYKLLPSLKEGKRVTLDEIIGGGE